MQATRTLQQRALSSLAKSALVDLHQDPRFVHSMGIELIRGGAHSPTQMQQSQTGEHPQHRQL